MRFSTKSLLQQRTATQTARISPTQASNNRGADKILDTSCVYRILYCCASKRLGTDLSYAFSLLIISWASISLPLMLSSRPRTLYLCVQNSTKEYGTQQNDCVLATLNSKIRIYTCNNGTETGWVACRNYIYTSLASTLPTNTNQYWNDYY
jgi:hypothetical protein